MTWFAGVDVGSLSADAVLLDQDGQIRAWAVLPTGNNSQKAGAAALHRVLDQAGITEDRLTRVISTGYSRARVEQAGGTKTEIACHAKGAWHEFPDAGTIIDIGGQDSKAIRVGPAGRVLNFAMNDKCAAGTGRFLEVMAQALDIPLDRMGDLAVESTEDLTISSICTVFAESEVVGLISQGKRPGDIARAVARSIARRTVGLAGRVGLDERVVMTGGVAKNRAVVQAISDTIGHPISVPKEPQIIGALGAALFARETESGG
ncbi:MAG: 2-hydroxyglutaryl-CoA dehydratase [Proteobacteria bacterium]|nr:2-hydroxyglutaryl-CoA dehydratase [Pseudomonadota bacterium]